MIVRIKKHETKNGPIGMDETEISELRFLVKLCRQCMQWYFRSPQTNGSYLLSAVQKPDQRQICWILRLVSWCGRFENTAETSQHQDRVWYGASSSDLYPPGVLVAFILPTMQKEWIDKCSIGQKLPQILR